MLKCNHENRFTMTDDDVSQPRLSVRVLIIMIITALVVSCAGTRDRAPIVEAEAIPSHRIQTHIVGPGETLYSIALRYDLDYKKLSQVNRLGSSNEIRPGQVLSLNLDSYQAPQTVAKPSPNTWQKVKEAVPDRSKNQTKKPVERVHEPSSLGSLKWQWPLNGKVLDRFNPSAGLNKGIDIRGELGEPVVAAADGEVVYSGSGLRGYGKLLIVKHNDKYLSAYAHNRVLHVAEGDLVKAGQKIAEVGFSGTNTAKLHFEIRLDGKPVDPLHYLPKL